MRGVGGKMGRVSLCFGTCVLFFKPCDEDGVGEETGSGGEWGWGREKLEILRMQILGWDGEAELLFPRNLGMGTVGCITCLLLSDFHSTVGCRS